MCHLFKTEPIVIKDCFNFSLKNIAKAMYKHGFITTNIESECNNGMTAMYQSYYAYINDDKKLLEDILKYNLFDVKVLYDIMNYLRKSSSL